MRTDIFRFTIVVVCCFSTLAVSLGDDEQSGHAARLAGQTLAVIDVLVEHHIAAPPRQELVRQVASVIRAESKLDPPHGISRQLSGMTESADFLALLTQEWTTALGQLTGKQQLSEAEELFQSVVWSLLRMSPGRNMLIRAPEHKVERQLAANRYVGTGIRLTGARDGQPPIMEKVFPDGPAHQVGALDGDKILEIDGTTTDGMPMAEVVKMLRGPGGTDVDVLLQQNDDEPRQYTITRGVVPIKQTHSERDTSEGKSIETIRFDRMTIATVSDLRKIEQQWDSPPDAILLDLQLAEFDLHQAVLLADALLDGGAIGRLETATGGRDIELGREALFAGIPMFVLISKQTIGTAEWIAAALQDQGRGTLVGEQTPGQPYISEPFDVPGTDWVLTLASGVLTRADGRRLLKTSSKGTVTKFVVKNDQTREELPASRVPREHDGGVLPSHPVTRIDVESFLGFLLRSPAPTSRPSRPPTAGPISAVEALPAIRILLDRSTSDRQEVD